MSGTDVVFGYDTARYISKHSSSKEKRLKNDSSMNKEHLHCIWNYQIGSKDLRKA